MLTAQTLAVEGLSYIGIFAVGAANVPWKPFQDARTAILARIAHDQTAALQDIIRARSDLYQTRAGVQIPAPQTQTVTLTQGSAVVTIGTPFTGINLDGATVNVGGTWTETRVAADSTVSLLHPFPGGSGSYAMTAYGDSILLDTTQFARVIGNVSREGGIPLDPLPNREALASYRFRYHGGDYGAPCRRVLGLLPFPGPPAVYWVETAQGSAGLIYRVRLAPLPDQAYSLDFDAEVRGPLIIPANLGNTDGSDPGVTFPLPDGLDESILTALFLARFCKSPWVKDQEHREFLIKDGADALTKLRDFQPQAETGASITMRGYVL